MTARQIRRAKGSRKTRKQDRKFKRWHYALASRKPKAMPVEGNL